MRSNPLYLHITVLLAAVFLVSSLAQATEPAPERRSEIIRMVRQDCGSCHGLTLKGGLGPALLPANLSDREVDVVAATVLHGRPGTPMPGWSQFLSLEEARWVVARLMSGFPEETPR